MKKILISSLLSAGALGAFGQAQLLYTDYGNTLSSHIWSPSTGNAVIQGNSGASSGSADNSGYTSSQATDFPVGSTVYPGSTLLGGSSSGSGPTAYANGNLWTAQLEALGSGAAGYANSGITASQLLPVTTYTATMNTFAGGQGQFSNPNTPGAGIPNTPYVSGNPTAAVALAAWYSGGGDTTLLAAQDDASGVWGESAVVQDFTVFTPNNLLPGGTSPNGAPPDLPTTSFNVGPSTTTPEPSTIAFGVIGACAFLARRKKS